MAAETTFNMDEDAFSSMFRHAVDAYAQPAGESERQLRAILSRFLGDPDAAASSGCDPPHP